jgi:hypothetical protein
MPRAIAIMLLAFGLWFSIRGLRRPFVGGSHRVRLQPLLAITASVAVFALTATRFGLALSSFATILIANLATRESRSKPCYSRWGSRRRRCCSSSRRWPCRCRSGRDGSDMELFDNLLLGLTTACNPTICCSA